jgi:hypothetical protein
MHSKPAIQPWLPLGIEGELSHDESTAERLSEDGGLMERVVERDNLLQALKRVRPLIVKFAQKWQENTAL